MADRPSSMMETPAESLGQLRVLGVPLEVLVDSLVDGHHGGASCSPLHPRWFEGSHQHADIVQGLRLRLIPLGWTVSEERGLATVVSPDRTFQVAVSSGDGQVGKEGSPRTKNPKGAATALAVAVNSKQGRLFGALPVMVNPRNSTPPSGLASWFLLYHQTESEIWFELSLPQSMGSDGRPNAWARRLTFAPINLGAVVRATPQSVPTEHVFDISRR
jgi:hypothetical protein